MTVHLFQLTLRCRSLQILKKTSWILFKVSKMEIPLMDNFLHSLRECDAAHILTGIGSVFAVAVLTKSFVQQKRYVLVVHTFKFQNSNFVQCSVNNMFDTLKVPTILLLVAKSYHCEIMFLSL